nr:hypothetical protein [uncultured Blautia sp.]
MKNISEQTKNFLLYGIEDVIKPKEIYNLDGTILFLFLFFWFYLRSFSPGKVFCCQKMEDKI